MVCNFRIDFRKLVRKLGPATDQIKCQQPSVKTNFCRFQTNTCVQNCSLLFILRFCLLLRLCLGYLLGCPAVLSQLASTLSGLRGLVVLSCCHAAWEERVRSSQEGAARGQRRQKDSQLVFCAQEPKRAVEGIWLTSTAHKLAQVFPHSKTSTLDGWRLSQSDGRAWTLWKNNVLIVQTRGFRSMAIARKLLVSCSQLELEAHSRRLQQHFLTTSSLRWWFSLGLVKALFVGTFRACSHCV